MSNKEKELIGAKVQRSTGIKMADKEKILVVDDEPSIRKYLQTLLEVDGFNVDTVASGKEALERIGGGERPDLIILDVLMPEIDGLETLRQMMHLDRKLNVIMLWLRQFAWGHSII
jgi:two-component system, OmpR family, response regulator MprA